jgi:DNA polymerase-3 subunit delta
MKSQELFQEIEEGKIYPLYYFFGPEKWLIEEALERIQAKVLRPATSDFNRVVLDAQEDIAQEILESLQVFPLNSPRRLVIIRQADIIWAKKPAPYFDYFANPNPLTCTVFLGEKADLRAKFFQGLEKNGAIVSFYPLPEREINRWICLQARQLGLSISEGAITLLVERVGPHLRDLKLEVQKLALKPGANQSIREEDILALTEDTRDENPFEMAWAVGLLDWEKALRLLRKNLQQGEPPLLLLSSILRQLRLIWRARELRARGSSKKEIEGKLRILPLRASRFWPQVDKFSSEAIEKIWPLTREADQELKSSRLDKDLILEKYLWDLFLVGNRKKDARGV